MHDVTATTRQTSPHAHARTAVAGARNIGATVQDDLNGRRDVGPGSLQHHRQSANDARALNHTAAAPATASPCTIHVHTLRRILMRSAMALMEPCAQQEPLEHSGSARNPQFPPPQHRQGTLPKCPQASKSNHLAIPAQTIPAAPVERPKTAWGHNAATNTWKTPAFAARSTATPTSLAIPASTYQYTGMCWFRDCTTGQRGTAKRAQTRARTTARSTKHAPLSRSWCRTRCASPSSQATQPCPSTRAGGARSLRGQPTETAINA